MKNKLSDVNEYLFESLDVLSNPDLSEEDLKKEIERSKQIASVSRTIIESGKLALDANKHIDKYHRRPNRELPELLIGADEDES